MARRTIAFTVLVDGFNVDRQPVEVFDGVSVYRFGKRGDHICSTDDLRYVDKIVTS